MIALGNLEANLARHCTLKCTNCNHGSAIADHWFMEPESMERDLAKLSKVAHFSFHCLQGGEPLLHKRLLDFMDIQERSGIADKYGILTNGTLLHAMPDEFWKKAARPNFELRWSVYPIITDQHVEEMTAKAKSFGVDFRPGRIGAFKPMLTTHSDAGQHVWNICPWKRCWTAHEGMLYHCPIAALFPSQFPERFSEPPHPQVDGYSLDTITEDTLKEMLNRQQALKSCEICTGAVVGNWVPWSQIKTGREDWIKSTTV
jgi:MoaA/NifB/PqqE/SkfB family radical SAM enzyme